MAEGIVEHVKTLAAMMKAIPGHPGFVGVYEYVVRYGTEVYSEEAFTEEEQRVIARIKAKKFFVPRHCFENAREFVLADRQNRFVYNEGFAFHIWPVHHAWVTWNNRIIDVTWNDTPADHYYGVKFPRELCRSKRDAKCTSVLDDWGDGGHGTTRGVPPEELAEIYKNALRDTRKNKPNAARGNRQRRHAARGGVSAG